MNRLLNGLEQAEVNYICLENCIVYTEFVKTCFQNCEHTLTNMMQTG